MSHRSEVALEGLVGYVIHISFAWQKSPTHYSVCASLLDVLCSHHVSVREKGCVYSWQCRVEALIAMQCGEEVKVAKQWS